MATSISCWIIVIGFVLAFIYNEGLAGIGKMAVSIVLAFVFLALVFRLIRFILMKCGVKD